MNECMNKDKFKLYGELLTANIFAIKKATPKSQLIIIMKITI